MALAMLVGSPMGPKHVRWVVYPGVLGLTGAAILAAGRYVSSLEGCRTTPDVRDLLVQGCEAALVAGSLGVVCGFMGRKRVQPKALSTLVISFCLAVCLLAALTKKELPQFVGVPMQLNPRYQGAVPSTSPVAEPRWENVPAQVAADVRNLKSISAITFTQDPIEDNDPERRIAITNVADVRRISSTIRLENKPSCWCLHPHHAVFQTLAGKVEVSFCEHCFDVEGSPTRHYKMQPKFYDEFMKTLEEHGSAGWLVFRLSSVTNNVGFFDFVATSNIAPPLRVGPNKAASFDNKSYVPPAK